MVSPRDPPLFRRGRARRSTDDRWRVIIAWRARGFLLTVPRIRSRRGAERDRREGPFRRGTFEHRPPKRRSASFDPERAASSERGRRSYHDGLASMHSRASDRPSSAQSRRKDGLPRPEAERRRAQRPDRSQRHPLHATVAASRTGPRMPPGPVGGNGLGAELCGSFRPLGAPDPSSEASASRARPGPRPPPPPARRATRTGAPAPPGRGPRRR